MIVSDIIIIIIIIFAVFDFPWFTELLLQEEQLYKRNTRM